MNIIDRLENFKLESEDHPDIAYLKSTSIGGVVNRALSDLYKVQPKNPVTFLANWLLNESRSNQIKIKIESENKQKQDLKEIYSEKLKEQEALQRQKDLETQKVSETKSSFLQRIHDSKDIENNLDSFCEDLEKLVNATGVYISILDKKRKEVSEDEDENAHLIDQQVIRYVNFSQSHAFLKYKFIENEQGVTYDLFKPKEETGDAVAEGAADAAKEGAEGAADSSAADETDEASLNLLKKPKEFVPNHILVDEVVRNPKVKFFREPRIGCYLAIDLTYKSCLSALSLNSAIDALNDFNAKIADYEQRKCDFLAKVAEENAQKEQLEGQEGMQADAPAEPEFPEENITLNEFEKTEKKFILSLDTIGQDRIFSDEEKKYIFESIRTIKESWENLEKTLLLKDRDLKIELMQKESVYRDQAMVEKLEAEEEKFLREHFAAQEIPITDEKEKQIENDLQKTKFILNCLIEDNNLLELFTIMKDFEFVEFEKIFQYIFYFIGYKNLDINEEKTNKLEWRKCRHLWNITVLEKLRQYNPYGPKGPVGSYSMGNKLLAFFESVDKEAVKKYSFALGRILDFMILILNVRKQDIIRRRDIKNEKIQERNNLILAKEERDKRKEAALEQAKEKAKSEQENPENPEEFVFDEETFWVKFNETDPEVIIPDEIVMDQDDDFEVML